MRHGLNRVLEGALVVLFVVLVLDVSWQVISRYALGAPSAFTEEVARFLFLWLAFVGAAYVTGQRGHLAIDLLSGPTQSERARRAVRVAVFASSLSFSAGVLGFGGVSLVVTSATLGQISPVLGLPLWVVYAVVPVAGGLMSFFLVSDFSMSPEPTEPTGRGAA